MTGYRRCSVRIAAIGHLTRTPFSVYNLNGVKEGKSAVAGKNPGGVTGPESAVVGQIRRGLPHLYSLYELSIG
jgi:hypothetical protein